MMESSGEKIEKERKFIDVEENEDGNVMVYSNPTKIPTRPADLKSIYMVHNGITNIRGFEKFINLQVVWLSKNMLTEFSGFDNCIRITKLYLQDNKLRTLKGSLKKLKFLNILMLHNNELRDLQSTIKDISHLQFLSHLTMYGNPLSHEEGYRKTIVSLIPGLKVLDRKNVKSSIVVKKKNQNHDNNTVSKSLKEFRRHDILPAEKRVIKQVNQLKRKKIVETEKAKNFHSEDEKQKSTKRPTTPPFPESLDFLRKVQEKKSNDNNSNDNDSSFTTNEKKAEYTSYTYQTYVYPTTKSTLKHHLMKKTPNRTISTHYNEKKIELEKHRKTFVE